jgi:hypothetical protein
MRIASIVAVCLAVPALAGAQQRAASLEAPLQATLGDPIDVIVTVTAAAGDEAAVPEQSFEPFEILAKTMTKDVSSDDAWQTYTFELQLLCFDVGVHELGPLRVRLTSTEGELFELDTDAREVEIHSLLANEPEPELRPATAPVSVEQDDYRLLIALGALLVLVLGVLIGWLLMRWWQRRDRPVPPPPPPPPPWETALAELRAHASRREAAIEAGQTEAWVDAVSDSVRGYLGRRFGFHGLESTTDEISTELANAKSLSIAPQEVVGFLGQCDLVKFARASLADEASQALIEDAVALVERTRPKAQREEIAS